MAPLSVSNWLRVILPLNVISPAAMGMPDGYPATTEVTVQLQDLGGRTKMVMTHAGIPADSPGAMGWNMALDKLEAHLAA